MNLINIHLGWTLVPFLGRRWRRLLLRSFLLRCLCPTSRRHDRLRLRLGQDRNGEVNHLVSHFLDLRARQDWVHVLRPLTLPDVLVFKPLLYGSNLLNDRLLIFLIYVGILLFSRGGLRHVVVEGLAKVGNGFSALVDFLVAEGDRV